MFNFICLNWLQTCSTAAAATIAAVAAVISQKLFFESKFLLVKQKESKNKRYGKVICIYASLKSRHEVISLGKIFIILFCIYLTSPDLFTGNILSFMRCHARTLQEGKSSCWTRKFAYIWSRCDTTRESLLCDFEKT